METWESHVTSRDNPAIEGTWGDTPWEFYLYNHAVPAELSTRTSMCVPVCSLDLDNPQVMLTLNLKRGGYEIPGGHLDPLENGALESASAAAARETQEETGLDVDAASLIPYGYIEVKNTTNAKYPPLSYMQFWGAHASNIPGRITDPSVDGAGIFTLDALRTMEQRGAIRSTEFQLVCFGIQAVLKNQGLSDGHITLP